ncbi:CCA tRNA nucleotidyltransferase [Paenibacillus flagellatus]|uniref:CCA tRNA nucleotidyltransferase n=1 Tax=Paenibacillus flagellatus TaxID=2211139 RepID=A0A2V5KT78_9BACL|nr:CCA tRNA nucleotidyltransferase [Paenibacillus flagellatus]PYI54887.1 CCA tRNA nucleotidyltransferase [Paenibacillus flagellatus]
MSESIMIQEGIQVLRRLEEAGYEAVFVGGCVRDRLLGRPLKDIDIATSALPQDVVRLFPRTAPTGLAHGTVTVIMETHTFEVTTYRKESEYEQFRRPKEVEFISDLDEDLRRRDFTINAMAQGPDGSCIDPFGGRDDLDKGIVRCVGDPMERFREDALRMLRGIRFACEYGFELEDGTWRALVRHAPLLEHVATERVTAELDRMIEGRSPDRAVALLVESGLPRHFKEPVEWPLARWERAPEATERSALAKLDGAALRWAGLFILMECEAEQAREAMKRLKFAGKKSDAVYRLLRADEWMRSRADGGDSRTGVEAEPSVFETVALGAVEFGRPVVREWLRLAGWRVEMMGDDGLRRLAAEGAAELERVPVDRIAELAVNGTDLTGALDKPAGPWLGRLLYELLTEAALRRLPNDRDVLLNEAKSRAKRETN